MVTHLEPDIRECEVRWALGSITMNRANGGDGIGISDHLTCLLRDLYAGQKAIVRTVHGTTYWFQIERV